MEYGHFLAAAQVKSMQKSFFFFFKLNKLSKEVISFFSKIMVMKIVTDS